MPKKKKINKKTEREHTEDYVQFLQKRLASDNYKANVSEAEYIKCQGKLKRARLKLRFMKR